MKGIIILGILLLLRILINTIPTAHRTDGPIPPIFLSLNISTIAVVLFIAIEIIRTLERRLFKLIYCYTKS